METGKIKSDTLKVADLPAIVTYKGKPIKIMGWKDKLGDNLLLLTETGEFASKDSAEYEDNRDAELHVYHYVKTAGVWQKIANVNDQISSCPVDIVTRFVPGALFVTDLDGDGIAEATFAYQLTCTGGVDNKVMKLIMLENKNKYVIRGTTTVNMGEKIPGTMNI
ncbi:M949_RS01915 family surface polysaccharide biosynthesis protein [Pedobacter sp. NJ-S-72]